MKQIVLFGVLLGLAACQPGADVTPVSLTNELAGSYQTNGFLDYRRLTQPTSQMPTVSLQTSGLNTVTLTISQSFPKASVQTLTDVALVAKADQSIELVQAGQVIGRVQTGRIFTANGMATQSRLLQLSVLNTSFIGYKP